MLPQYANSQTSTTKAANKSMNSTQNKDSLKDILKKYRGDERSCSKHTESKMAGFMRLFELDNKTRLNQVDKLMATYKRICARTFEHVNYQTKVKMQDNMNVNWIEEERNRIRVENNCLLVEMQKLKVQITNLKEEIKSMVQEDEEKRIYFEDGLPLELKSWSQITIFRNFAKTLVAKTQPTEMSNFKESEKEELTKISKHAASFEDRLPCGIDEEPEPRSESDDGLKDEKNFIYVEEKSFKIDSKKNASMVNLLPKFRGRGSPAKLDTDIYSMNAKKISSKRQRSPGAPDISRARLNSEEACVKKRAEDSASISRIRSREISNVEISRVDSCTSEKRRTFNREPIARNQIRAKADQVMVKIDQIVQHKFGSAYSDLVSRIAAVDNRILRAEKVVKRRLRSHRHACLVLLNIALCFKRAFQVLIQQAEPDTQPSRAPSEAARSGIKNKQLDLSELAGIEARLIRIANDISNDIRKEFLQPTSPNYLTRTSRQMNQTAVSPTNNTKESTTSVGISQNQTLTPDNAHKQHHTASLENPSLLASNDMVTPSTEHKHFKPEVFFDRDKKPKKKIFDVASA